jgi:hypothetical protein
VSQALEKPAVAALAKYGFSPTGLRLKPGMPFEEWAALGAQIARFSSATQWALGDWWFYGEWEYGSMYEKAMEATGLSYQTLADLKYVASRFEFSRRREKLSLSHHREVAPRDQDEQDRFLDLAEEHGWSREKLRLALAGKLSLSENDPDLPPAEPIRISVVPLRDEVEHVADRALAEDSVRLCRIPQELVAALREWSPPVRVRLIEAEDGLVDLDVQAIEEER